MPRIDCVVESRIARTSRVRQLEAMFDVPAADASHLEWHGDVDLDARPWNVGLIVGPSGSGKTTMARAMFADAMHAPAWRGEGAVVDEFAADASIADIASACQAVGFNTIPAWLRPYNVLSMGERFRVELARRFVETTGLVVVDEFTSTVDRQVANIGSHAVQKWARRNARQFVAVTCHYDVMEWLQPDWVLEPATMTLTWRALQRRPPIDGHICRVPRATWQMFAPYHYLTADLPSSANCFALIVRGRPVAFAGVRRQPHASARNIMALSRLVTLPDWQGLGLSPLLATTLGALYKATGERLHSYPAHPALIRTFDKSSAWAMRKRPGTYASVLTGPNSSSSISSSGQGGRPNAVFAYTGPAHADSAQARAVLS